jgi:type VI secretion system TssD-like protein
MSFLAKLTLEDGEGDINVIQCSFNFTHPLSDGRFPTGHVQAGLIHIVVESSKWTGLLDWMVSKHWKDGKIVFVSRTAGDGLTSNKTLSFKRAMCVELRESFDAENNMSMTTHFSILPEIIEIGDVSHEMEWSNKKQEG